MELVKNFTLATAMNDNNDKQFFIYLVVGLSVLCIWLYSKLAEEKKQKEKLEKEKKKFIDDNAILKAQNLKFQLEPHAFKSLIGKLKVKASELNKGLDSFNLVLEYILYEGKENFVTIEKELNFIEDYLRLNKIFIDGSNLVIIEKELNLKSKHYLTLSIPHMSTVCFIENAFQHGEISEEEPLKITVKSTDELFEFCVINKLRQNKPQLKGGIGLKNLEERLNLLLPKKCNVTSIPIGEYYHSTLKIKF